jgi:hypothetical protein
VGSVIARCAPVVLLLACQGEVLGSGDGGGTPAGPAGPDGPGNNPTQVDLPRPPVGTFTGPIVSTPSTSSRFVRLNHKQWENSVKDALKLAQPLGLSNAFVAEPLRSTFDTNGSLLSVSADTFRDYQIAAESLAATLAHDSAIMDRLAPGDDAATFIKNLGKRAFRRPLTDAEVTACQALFAKGAMLIGSGDDFADGAELVASYLFQSPYFVYRTELSTQVVDGKVPLGAYEIASKLSYAVTESMPDDALLVAADGNQLSTRDQVIAQIKRLLATPAAAASLLSFHEQMLVMREFETISKREEFTGFGEGVGEDLKEEARHFIQDVVFQQDKGFQTLFSAPYTYANDRVRGLYGMPATGGGATSFTRLELDPTQRAGLLTQIGFLAANAEQETPNIIIRGVHIARKVLCSALPDPPDDVPPLPAQMPGSTNRQRVDAATKDAPCNGCHTSIINPLGYALESLDGLGRYRAQDNGQAIDAATSYTIDGKAVNINGPVELASAIASSDEAHACYAQNWAEYLYGRVVTRASDNQLVQQGGWLSRDAQSAQNLIVNLLATDAFLTRLP